MMKILSKMGAIAILAFVLATSSYGGIIAYTTAGNVDVGQVDTIVGQSELANSSEASETGWVSDLLGTDVDFVIKNTDVPYFDTDTTDTYAFSLGADVDYFIVKNATWSALYSNNDVLSWGVFDTSSLDESFNLPSSDYTISHVSTFDGSLLGSEPSSVPEPSSILLLGLGLLGFISSKYKT